MSNLYNEEDDKYKDVINALKGLKKVDAPEDFEMNLFREINTHKHRRKPHLYFGILPRFTLIPASVVFTVLAVAVVIIMNQSPEIKQVKADQAPTVQQPQQTETVKPEVADKKTAPPASVKKETQVFESSSPADQEITTATRGQAENKTTTIKLSEEESAAPVLESNKSINTVKSSDTTSTFQKAGKITKKDSVKHKKTKPDKDTPD